MQKITNFIKYNNGFTIAIAAFLLIAGSSFASEKVRDTVIGQTIEETKGMDNSALLVADLNSLKQEMSITDVSEDEENYLVSYAFATFDIKDNTWQNQTKTQTLKVPKDALNGGKDLGLYVQSELAQIMDSQMAYLKNAQEREQKKGETKITKTTKYTGLKGLVLNSETKELEGYEPVMKKEERVEQAYVAPAEEVESSSSNQVESNQVESSSSSSSNQVESSESSESSSSSEASSSSVESTEDPAEQPAEEEQTEEPTTQDEQAESEPLAEEESSVEPATESEPAEEPIEEPATEQEESEPTE